jgi:MYXO-CTERM domain-containing protein
LPDSGASACNAPVYEWQGTQWHRYCAIGKAPNFTNRFVAAAYDVVGRRMVVNIDGDETWFFTALATPCATGDDCNGTQYCAAGSKICCNEPCDASCATCNPDTGECEIVAADQSAPGKDPCSPADAEFCEKTRCDGMSVHCQLAHAGESCRSDTCADGGFTAGASCTQFGVCPEPDPSACNGYLCAPNQEKCATSCDGECAPDYCCIGGSCTFCAPTCSDAGNQVVSADGGTLSCGAYACVDGACVSSCVANADCASEHVCVKGGACRKLFDEQPDEDPCSCRVVGERRPLSTGFAALALALFALSLRRRRRRDPRSAARGAPSCGAGSAD